MKDLTQGIAALAVIFVAGIAYVYGLFFAAVGLSALQRMFFTSMLVAVAALTPSALKAGNCHQLFHHRQAIVHHVAPQVFYFAGQATQDESIVRKVVREELRQALQAPPQQQTAATSGAFAKCAKCHKGDNALTSDPGTFKAFARMAGLGEGIPNEMKAVIGSLTPAEKGEITEYLLRLPAARTEPEVTIPPPEQSGILR